ncbi:MAG: YggT family protein [Alphaproteobacteria bacterium]|nr:YggT family protein [Alphaproteobacteria bacterium]
MPVLISLLAALLDVLRLALSLYIWLLVVGAVLSWLLAFDVVNPRNRAVHVIGEFCFRLTEPVLRPIRKRLPAMGGIDISPIILILLIMFLQSFLSHLLVSL